MTKENIVGTFSSEDAKLNPIQIYKEIYQILEQQKEDCLEKISTLLNQLNQSANFSKNDVLHELIANIGTFCYDANDPDLENFEEIKKETVSYRVKIISDFLKQEKNHQYFNQLNAKGQSVVSIMFGLFEAFDEEFLKLAINKTDKEKCSEDNNLLDILVRQKLIDPKNSAKIKAVVDEVNKKGITISYNDEDIAESLLHSRCIATGLTEMLCKNMIKQGNITLFINLLDQASGRIHSSQNTISGSIRSFAGTPRQDEKDVTDFINKTSVELIKILINEEKIHFTDEQGRNVFFLVLDAHLQKSRKENPLDRLWIILQKRESLDKFSLDLFKIKNKDGQTILHRIIATQSKNLIEGFINRLSTITDEKTFAKILNETDKEGNNLLHIAAINNLAPDVIKFLVEKGVSRDLTNHKDETPLHLASKKGLTKQHLEQFCNDNLDAQDSDLCTALHYAAEKDFIVTAEYLLQRGAKSNIPNIRGETPIVLSIKRNQETITQVLLLNGVDPDSEVNLLQDDKIVSNKKTTLLDLAIENENFIIVKFLMEAGATRTKSYEEYLTKLDEDQIDKLDKAEVKASSLLKLKEDIKKIRDIKNAAVADSGVKKLTIIEEQIRNLLSKNPEADIKKLSEQSCLIFDSYNIYRILETQKEPSLREESEKKPSSSTAATSFFAQIFKPKSLDNILNDIEAKLLKDDFGGAKEEYKKYVEQQSSQKSKTGNRGIF